MSYRIDPRDKSIVIDGFQNGIADSPFDGISDMRNVNIISVPGEASVNFATSAISPPSISTGTVSSANAGTKYLTYTGAANLENYMTINFSAQSGLNVSTGTAYWVANVGGAGAGTFQIYSDYAQTALVAVTNGTGTFSVAKVGTNLITGATGKPNYFTYSKGDAKYFMQDATGAVWSNLNITTSGYWTYLGPSGTADTNAGNGLVYYEASDGTRWVFAFTNGGIDYFDLVSLTWTWGWKPSTGQTHQANYMKKNSGVHNALVAPDNKVYFCDGAYIDRWYQADPSVPFVPTTPSTYIFDQTQLLPFTDIAQCIAPLGNNLLIGGIQNIVYPWDTFSQLPSFPIFVAEYNIVQLLTVNTNCFIFAGNRGRIYYTNGSQAQLYKKMPDHLTGTVEPYYTWGGVMSNKNQLYFGVSVTDNAGIPTNEYGGLWAVDLDTKALRMTNTLSYQTTTYAGYPTAMIPNFGTTPLGTGFFVGWDKGSANTYGIDTSSGSPYAGGQTVAVARIDSDYIPIGTFNMPRDFERVEYRLTKALVSGESILIQYRLLFDKTDQTTPAINTYTTILTDSTVGNYSNSTAVNFKNAQWIQMRAVLTSTASSPSYTRLKEWRITGQNQ